MATNNEQTYNQNYKMRYSKEIELLDALEHQLNEAANNLDIDKMDSLITEFERKFYSDLRISNKQSFDVLKASAHQRIIEIRKRKELLAQRQRELQATEDAYKKLQDIKKMVLGAKTKSELEKAKKKYEAWKNEIGRSRKIKFGWKYNSKVDNLKYAIEQGIGPEDAITEFKTMIERASHSGGFENASPIKDWMNKYPLNAFHEVYKKEVNNLIDKAFSLVKQPEEETENIQYLSTLVPGFMFMSPTQAYAVNDLKKIMDKNSKNFKSLLEWIYTYRNVSFSEPYRQAISALIPVEYGLNSSNQYSIPVFYDNAKLKTKEIKDLVKDTVINYFGILLCGNDLTSTKKQFIVDTFAQSQMREAISEITKNDEAVDTIIKAEENNNISITYSEENNTTELTTKTTTSEEINPEIKEPAQIKSTSTIPNITTAPELQVEISSILPEIQFEESQLAEEIVDNTILESSNETIINSNDSSPSENTTTEYKSSNEPEINYEDFADTSIEIPLTTPKLIQNSPEEPATVRINSSTNSSPDINLDSPHDYDETVATTSEHVNDLSQVNPYQLTENDVENIECIYFYVLPRTKKSIKSEYSIETEEQEEENDLLYQKLKD